MMGKLGLGRSFDKMIEILGGNYDRFPGKN